MDMDTTAELAAYLQGGLPADAQARLRQRLAQDPALRAELQLLQAIRGSVREELAADDAHSQALLATTLARIRGAPPAPVTPSPTGQVAGGWRRWWGSLRGDGETPRFGFATAALVVLAQFGVIAGLLFERSDEYADTRARPVVAAPVGPFIKVSLRPESTEADVRFLLLSVGASIVGGPTALGDYFLFVPRERVDAVVQQIRQSRVVDQAEVIASLPAAKE